MATSARWPRSPKTDTRSSVVAAQVWATCPPMDCGATSQSCSRFDLSGVPIQPVTSSFSAPIELGEPVTADEYLQHSIRGIYVMETENDG